MMNAGNLKGKTRQTSDWRRRMIAFVSALTLLISSCGLTAFAETDEDIYSDPVTAPIPSANTSPEPEEGEAQATPAPEGQPEEGTEPQEATGEGTETEGEPEVSEEPEDLTVYEPGTLTAEADGIGITVDYTAEARVPEGAALTLTRAAGGDLYSALKSASKVLKTEENATWKRELGEDAVFYAITLTNPEGNEVHPETGVTLTCTNLEIPADATGFVTGDNAENLDWKDTLTVEFLPDAIGYAYLKQVQIGTVTLTHEDRDYMVTAAYGPDAGFPADTELKVREILPGTPEYALYSGMTDEALNEDWAEITLERYFDIAFVANGEELEPKAEVDVQIVFRDKIEQNEETEVAAVHIENNEANVIEAETDSTKSARHDDEAIDTVTFTSDSFSVYGVVQKKKIITKVLAADGNTYEINVTYGPEAEIPEGAELKVEEIPEGSDLWEAYRKQTAAALGADDVRLPGLYDITIIFEGREVEPKAPISVAITLANAEAGNEELNVVHFKEEIPPELVDVATEQTEVQPLAQEDQINAEHITDTTIDGQTVTFETDGFSIYAFAYTVVVYYKVATGETYRIKLDYDEDSGIPAGSVLKVDEILPDDARYAGYLEQAIKAATKTEDSEEKNEDTEEAELIIPDDQYARFFDIEIQSNGQKVEPTGKVSVTVELADAPEDRLDELKVVHFRTEKTEVLEAQVSAENITFETDSFSVYGVITGPETLPFDLNGRMFKIKNGSHYMSRETDYSSNLWAVKKTNDSANAAMFTFEAGTEPGKYRIYTTWKDNNGIWRKFYIHINHRDGNPTNNASVNLTEYGPMDLDVQRNNDGTYAIWRTIDGKRFYLNRHNGDGGPGFATYTDRNNNNGKLTLEEVTTDHTNDGKENTRMLIVKYADKYYIVNNDASLTEVEYIPHTNQVKTDNPMMWVVEQNSSNGHIYFNSKEAGFNGNQLASDWYRRYLDPNNAVSAWTEEDGIKEKNVNIENHGNYTINKDGRTIEYSDIRIKDRSNILRNTALSIDSIAGQNTYRIHSNSNYIGIAFDSNGTPVRLIGQETNINNAAEILFATPFDTKNASYLKNSVNHIDISIKGTANVSVPLAKGNYYGPQGDKADPIKTVVDNVKIDLKQEYLVNPDQIRITDEDMKRATLTAASMKTGESLDNVFYITGYSGNVDNGLSSAQVRIEGSFMVADLRNTPYETVDKYLYDNNSDYKKAVRDARLANKIEYTVTLVKPMTYYLKDNGTQLCDENGEAITVTVDVAFSASFDYWSNKNECPPVHGIASNESENEWKNGNIDSSDWSGMDFVLGGVTDDTQSPPYAIQITKVIQDTNGNRIKLKYPVTTYFKIYENKSDNVDKNGVAGLHVNQYGGVDSRDANIYDDYSFWRDKRITVGEDGSAIIFDLNANNAMYYIEELHDTESLPEYVTDVNGNIMEYVNTYIETEYVTRGDTYSTSSNDPMHVTDYFTRENENGYKSIPEVAGHFIGVDNAAHYERFLEFYVYNVYEPITSITVSKLWQDTDGTALSASEIPSSATFKLKRFYNTGNTGTTTPASGGSGRATVKIMTSDGEHTYHKIDDVPIGSSVRFIITITAWQGNDDLLTYKYGSTEGSFQLDQIGEKKCYYSEIIPVNGDITINLLQKIPKSGDPLTINKDNKKAGYAFHDAWPYLEVIEGSGSSISNGTTTTTRVEDTVFNNSNEHTLTLPISGSWTGSFTDLEKTGTALIDGTEKEVTYYYYIEEQSALGAQWSVTYENNTGIIGPGTIIVTNKKEPPHETSVTVNKQWVNVEGATVDWPKDGEGNYTPAYVTVQLQRRANSSDAFTDVNGAVQNIYPEEGDGQHTTVRFDNLDPAYEYTVVETAIDGVKSTIVTNADGSITVKNLEVPTVDIEAKKEWSNVPEEDQVNAVQFTLYQKIGNGQATAVEQSATLTNPQAILKDQDWSGKAIWSNLPAYDVTGETPVAITYSVEETGIFTGDLESGALPADPTWTPAATRYTVSGNGNVSFSEGSNSSTVIITNTKITVPLLKVTKEWYNVLPEDLVYYPTVYFTLYQMKATDNNFNDAHIYRPGGDGDDSFVNIPLSYAEGWTWTYEYLPETDAQGNPVKYFAAERTADGNVGTRTVYLDDPYWNVNDNVRVQTIEYKSRSTVGTGDDWDRRGEPNNPDDAWVGNSGEILIRNTALDYMQMDVKKKFLYYYPNQGGYGYSLGTGTDEDEYLHDRVIVIQVMRRAVIDDGSNTEAFGWQPYGEPIAVGYGPGGVRDHIEINGINGIENPFTLVYQSSWMWRILEDGGLIGFGFYTVNNQRVRVIYQYTLKELGAYSDRALTHPLNDFDWTAILPEVWDGTGKHVNVFGNLEAQDPDRLVNVQSTDLSISKTWSATNTDVEEVYVKVFRNSGVNYNSSSSKQDYTNVIGTRLDNSGALQPVYDGEIASDNLVTIDGKKYIKVPADGTAITISKIPTLQYGQNPEKYYYWIEECGYKPINGDPVMNTDRYTVTYTVSNVDTLAGDSNRTGSAVIRLGGKGTNTFTILNTSSEGALNITKAVTTGSEADDEIFTFEAVLTPADGESIDTATLAVTGGTLSSAVKDDNTGVVTVTLTITGTGTAVITGIPAETTYVVTETGIPDNWKQSGDAEYSDPGKTVSAGETSDTVTIKNTEVVNVTVKKTWGSTTTWPEGLTVLMTLKKNGDTAHLPEYNNAAQNAEAELTSANAVNGHTWFNLQKYDSNGDLITYSVAETGMKKNGEAFSDWADYYSTGNPQESNGVFTIDNTPKETSIEVLKVNESTKEPLSGARFTLERKGMDDAYAAYPDAEHNMEESDSDGKLTFTKLPDGTYRITETKAPDGYYNTNILVYFTISDGTVKWVDEDGTELTEQTKYVTYNAKGGTGEIAQFTIGNTPGAELPATGGSGTLIYTITGIFLITLAGMLLVARKRKANR